MPWQNNGDYYCFKEEDIEVYAPPASGVYGLYNFRHHITIDASANIHEALLRLLRDSTFRFSRFEPTGFTFEVCPKESRESRKQQLILEYNPITQFPGGIGLRSLWHSWMTPGARAFDSQATLTRQESPQKKDLPTETKTPLISPDPAARFSRDKFVLAGAICSVLLLVITVFAMLPYLKSSPGMVLWQILSALHRTTSAEQQTAVRSLTPRREPDMTAQRSTASEPNALENDRNREQKSEGGIESPAAENSAPAAITPPETPVTQPVNEVPVSNEEPRNRRSAPSSEKTAKHWVVQVMATIYPDEAVVWMEKLNAKGYDAFVAEVEIAGKRWYRVRLGAFKTRGEAETLAALVRQKEGLRDAFVTGGAASETVAFGRHEASPNR